jgi:hypothetical protein
MTTITDLITPGACESTVAGWIWYCDDCDTHGNADSADEADYMARYHAMYRTSIFIGDEDNEEEFSDESKYVFFRDLDAEGQELYEDELGDTCQLFIINVGVNKTFEYGEDYTDETPNQIVDIEVAQEIRRQLGLP